nr:immunoglobulin heavy chain junction region [Macaca mulatta]MOW83476.1 immunoglobulin heavy chain junction region [Macaca mulatta]MOW85080.1 immunoglobulin heavy chain junction region [Macaca mulatta]
CARLAVVSATSETTGMFDYW